MLKRTDAPNLTVRFASSANEIKAAQRLRYRVFVEELGASCSGSAHKLQQEFDVFDHSALHLCLFDQERETHDPDNAVVGVYRLITEECAKMHGGFYSEDEFDLGNILSLEGKKLELGRSCLAPEYRGGLGMALLWSALGTYIEAHNIDYLFGTASYCDPKGEALNESLSYLHHKYLAPLPYRAQVRTAHQYPYTPIPFSKINRLNAMRHTPTLVKAYLRMGGMIGEGAYWDDAFNTVDIFILMDTRQLLQNSTRFGKVIQ